MNHGRMHWKTKVKRQKSYQAIFIELVKINAPMEVSVALANSLHDQRLISYRQLCGVYSMFTMLVQKGTRLKYLDDFPISLESIPLDPYLDPYNCPVNPVKPHNMPEPLDMSITSELYFACPALYC